MRSMKVMLAAGAALCAAPAPAQPGAGTPVTIRDADARIWEGAADQGPVTHRMTASVFPGEIGGFKRFRLMAVDDGADVVLNYRRDGDPTSSVLSVFMFKPDGLPEHKLAGSIRSLGVAAPNSGMFLWSDGPFAVDGALKLQMFKATYKTGIGPDTAMDYLYFAPLGQWTVKVRATLASPKDVADEAAIDGFVRALPWDAIARANGACAGAACDLARPMAFNHHIMEGMLGRLAETLRGKPDAAKLGASAPVYAINAGGADWRLNELDAKLAEFFGKGFGGVNVRTPLYTLVRERKGKSDIKRFFSGKPTEAAFNAEVAGLVKTPEENAFISPLQAAGYQAD